MKKFTALFLILSLLEINCATIKSSTMEKRFPEKQGARLLITKRDWQQVEGELIAVKPTSLLLLNTEGKDMTVFISDIRTIRIVKKSKFFQTLGMGVLIGAVTGAIIGFAQGETESALGGSILEGGTLTAGENALIFGAIFGFLGFFTGVAMGLASGGDEKIQIEGKSEKKIRKTLDYLRKKARVRDYK